MMKLIDLPQYTVEYPRPEIPDFITDDGKILLRGTPEWVWREVARKANGCCLLSFDPIPERVDRQIIARLISGHIKRISDQHIKKTRP